MATQATSIQHATPLGDQIRNSFQDGIAYAANLGGGRARSACGSGSSAVESRAWGDSLRKYLFNDSAK